MLDDRHPFRVSYNQQNYGELDMLTCVGNFHLALAIQLISNFLHSLQVSYLWSPYESLIWLPMKLLMFVIYRVLLLWPRRLAVDFTQLRLAPCRWGMQYIQYATVLSLCCADARNQLDYACDAKNHYRTQQVLRILEYRC
jgi:hypothetical protein